MHQVPLIISAIHLFQILISSICSYLLYQSFTRIYATLFSTVLLVFLSASHIRPFCFRSHCVSNPSKLFSISKPLQLSSGSIIFLYEVIVPCTCIKSLYNSTFWYQLLLSLTGICFPNKILVSSVPISYSSVTTQFLYS